MESENASSDAAERRGRCLCGAVQISTGSAHNSVGACHCAMCRRWCGGPFMALECGTDITIEDEDAITIYDSSPWAERGFCGKCGTNLFYRLKQSQQYFLTAGLFDDATGFVFESQVFVDERPPYYDFANKTKDLTGAEIVEMYGSSA